MNNKILIISAGLPLKNSKDAGSSHVFGVINELVSTGYSVHLIAYSDAYAKDFKKDDLPRGLESYSLINIRNSPLSKFRVLKVLLSLLDPLWIYWKPSDGKVKRLIRAYLSKYEVRVINIQWTSMARFIPFIKRHCPNVKVVTSMHDIDSQAFLRKLPNITLIRNLANYLFQRVDKEVIMVSDIVLTLSPKDVALLKDIISTDVHGKILSVKPNLELFWDASKVTDVSTIGFFGAMYRPENYTAVEWFLDNVWDRLIDKDITFKIAGDGLPYRLTNKISSKEKIIYSGFVENLKTFIEECDIIVAPLLTGAGIKNKVLQALSAGRPVVGSNIAYEGIDEKNLFTKCITPDDYYAMIMKLKRDSGYLSSLSKLSAQLVKDLVSEGKTTAEVLNSLYD